MDSEKSDNTNKIMLQLAVTGQPPGFGVNEPSEYNNISVHAANKRGFIAES